MVKLGVSSIKVENCDGQCKVPLILLSPSPQNILSYSAKNSWKQRSTLGSLLRGSWMGRASIHHLMPKKKDCLIYINEPWREFAHL